MKSSKNYISLKSIDYEDMTEIGRIFSKFIFHNKSHLIYLKGELGSGKTSFVRAIMRGLGVLERIPSPSFSITEIYNTPKKEIIHIDMFRIASPEAWRKEEIRSYIEDDENLIFLEWPDKAFLLPKPNLLIEFFWSNDTNPNGPRDLKISGLELESFFTSISTSDLKKFNYEQ
jgi:tRNA threonylcarbamoyladenosine biosynthesis protein TsaE